MFVQKLLVRWLLDPMHIEVNVARSVLKHIYGTNDGEGIRKDCKDAGVQKEAWLVPLIDGTTYTPPARWVIPLPLRKAMNRLLSEMRFPTGYGALVQRSVNVRANDGKAPHSLKSHDYHKIMQHILPVALRCNSWTQPSYW